MLGGGHEWRTEARRRDGVAGVELSASCLRCHLRGDRHHLFQSRLIADDGPRRGGNARSVEQLILGLRIAWWRRAIHDPTEEIEHAIELCAAPTPLRGQLPARARRSPRVALHDGHAVELEPRGVAVAGRDEPVPVSRALAHPEVLDLVLELREAIRVAVTHISAVGGDVAGRLQLHHQQLARRWRGLLTDRAIVVGTALYAARHARCALTGGDVSILSPRAECGAAPLAKEG